MLNPIKEIYKFNKEAGLLEKGYYDAQESAYPIEEMLEGFEDIQSIAFMLKMDRKYPSDANEVNHPKEVSRELVKLAGNFVGTDVDRLDKHLDAIVFNFGSIFKLGLTPQEAMNALNIVMQANMQKLKVGQDEMGKQMKPEDFVGPEEQLQKLLDKRNQD